MVVLSAISPEEFLLWNRQHTDTDPRRALPHTVRIVERMLDRVRRNLDFEVELGWAFRDILSELLHHELGYTPPVKVR